MFDHVFLRIINAKCVEMLDAIEKALDMDNIENVCHIVSKLSKNIKQNRQRLIDIIERCEE